jgi:antitoxin component of MazEF toxin-antitoxin module
MRLLSQKSREYKGKSYHKHWIVVPNSLITKLGWKVGQDLEAEVKNSKLIISKNDKVRVDLVEVKK